VRLESWVSDVGKAVQGLRGVGVLDIRQPPEPDLFRTVASSGFPGVLPLWGGSLQTVGLLVDPTADAQAWPAVVLRNGQGLTVATDARTVLPRFIVDYVLSNFPRSAERLAEQWGDVEPAAVDLHQALGGSRETLDEVMSVVRNPEGRAAFKHEKGREAAFQEAHSTLLRKVDRSEPFAHYARWLDRSIEGQWIAPEDPARYGSWGRRVLCWASRLARRRAPPQRLSTDLLQRVVEAQNGIDSGVPVVPSWSVRPAGASGEAALVEAATLIENDQPTGNEIGDGLVRALVTEGLSYRGFAHAEATVAFDERGEAKRAWEALQSAAWWAVRNTGELPAAMIDGARFMATRHNWSDVRWLIERAAGAA
jgi:hypothetical protein